MKLCVPGSAKTFIVTSVLAAAAPLPAAAQEAQETPARGSEELQEVIVSAQKRTENLQDVPVPVTAISADTLLESNLVRIQDFYTLAPGLTVMPDDSLGRPNLTIRGISTGAYSNPTVGVTVDDVSFGSSTSLGGGGLVPDIDPSDLARVEVLRGPQGPLYGASSLGGVLKFVTVDPSTESLSGRVEGGTNTVYNGPNAGYSVRGAVNVPLSDTLAVRATAYARQDPGYIDNVVSGQRGVNKLDAEGFRISGLWRPSDAFSLKLSALQQYTKAFGSADFEPSVGDLKQDDVPGTGVYDRRATVYSAIANTKLGSIDLASITGYSIDTLSHGLSDLTPAFGFATLQEFGVADTVNTYAQTTTKFSQELRLSAPLGQRVDSLFGVFYTHERSPMDQELNAENPAANYANVGEWVNFDWVVTYAEIAAFTDLTFHLTDQFDIQVGGRESKITQSYQEVDSGPYVPLFEGFPSPLYFPRVVTHNNAATYLVTPEFKFTPDLMVYSRLASGYRPGGPNSTAVVFGLPTAYQPDKTQNYEIGIKGEIPGHALSFDASAYYIDWKNIQITLFNPVNELPYDANGSRAKSQGVELTLESKPLKGLTISNWLDWNEAVLTQALPAASSAVGAVGDRLPYTARFSGNVSAEQTFPLAGRATGFVGGTLSYVGDRESIFTTTGERQDLPAYAKTDLRAGSRYDSWTFNLYCNNVADKRGVLSGGLGSDYSPLAFIYIQPRTVGLSVTRTF